MEWWRPFLTRLVAADPGMRRFRAATQVIVAVVLAVGVALPALTALHQPVTAVAAAAVVAMVSMLAVRAGGREGVLTTLVLPVAATVTFTLAALVHGSLQVAELVFVGVMFVAVWMRRFGPRAFAAGMAAFLGYFLALFLQVSFAALPAMAGAAVVGACAALLARFVLLPERPDSAWRSGVRALRARVHTLLHAVDALGAEPGSAVRRRRVHDQLLRLNATALSLGTTFAALDELPPERADALRRHVLDVELAAGALVTAVDGLVDGPVDAAARPAVARVTAALDHDVAAAARASREIADQLDGAGSPAVGMAVRRLAAAAADLGTATLTMQHDTDVPAAPEPVDDGARRGTGRTGRAARPAADDPHRDPGRRRRHLGDPRRRPGGTGPVVLGGDHGVRGVRRREQPRRAARAGMVADRQAPSAG